MLSATYTGPAIWANRDHDELVEVTGLAGEQNGQAYFYTQSGRGALPDSELRPLPALRYTRSGLSVIPCGRDKRPDWGLLPKADGRPTWEPYQKQIADERTILGWFSGGEHNLGVVAGQVSGGLCVIDFDEERFFYPWFEHAGELADGLPIQRSGKGFHVFFRAPNPGGNQKLGWVRDDNEDTGRRCAIETRGEGGYVLVSPSIHPNGSRYTLIAGDLDQIPTLTQDKADRLLQLARDLDEAPRTRQEIEQAAGQAPISTDLDDSVIDEFNQRNPINGVLEKYGYTKVGRGYARPGGNHASVTIRDGKSFHHNSSDPLSNGYWRSAFDVYATYEHGGDYKSAARAAAKALGMPKKKKLKAPRGESTCTDLGNAMRFSKQHVDELRFVPEWGWLMWDGRRWQRDNLGGVMRLAWETVRGIYKEAADEKDVARARELASWAHRSQDRARLAALISLAEAAEELVAPHELFDLNPMLINCLNGTLDLTTGNLQLHARDDMLTRVIPVRHDPSACCPRWNTFLTRIFDNDTEMIAFLQRAVGYTMTGLTNEQSLFFLYGMGNNGKSVFTRTLERLMGLGQYAIHTRADTIMIKHTDNGIPNDIARLAGARLVVASEIEQGRKLNESMIKDMTGEDTLTGRFLHREFFDFRPIFKLWMYGNHKPVIQGTDKGIWRRILRINFNVTIPEEERDPQLGDRLLEELPGIFNWALEGCLAWQLGGLEPPASVTTATEHYREEMDPLGDFWSSQVAETGSIGVGQFYDAYVEWAYQNGETPISKRHFGECVTERGWSQARTTGGARAWQGISLR